RAQAAQAASDRQTRAPESRRARCEPESAQRGLENCREAFRSIRSGAPAQVMKLNLVLCAMLFLCALALVTSQHRARKLFSELTQEEELTKQLDVEWGQLQLEQSTWAMHARVEKIASGQLQMSLPSGARLRLLSVGPAGLDRQQIGAVR